MVRLAGKPGGKLRLGAGQGRAPNRNNRALTYSVKINHRLFKILP
jgi:hypothetical protein